jgi:hypothetical protein
MSTTEAKASTTNTILAIIADHLSSIRRLLGDESDLHSVTEALYQIHHEDAEKVRVYKTGDDFMSAWQAINEE